MDLILRDKGFRKKQVIRNPIFSCSTGLYGTSTNDFELVLTDDTILPIGDLVTYGTTEFGGCILNRIVNTEEKNVKYIGKSFRGQLENSIVNPFKTLKLSGTSAEMLTEVFSLSQVDYKIGTSGGTITRELVLPKASNALKAADLIMATFDEKMVFFVSNRGVEINLYTTDKNSFDASQVDLIVDENQLLPTAIHAYNDSTSASVFLQNDGSVGANRYYTGFQAVEISEEMSADSKSELTSLASDRLLALRTSKTASEIDVKIEDAEIGDKINVSVRKFGVKATQVVSEKILKIENKNAVITFNTGG